jgi:signal peptidase I
MMTPAVPSGRIRYPLLSMWIWPQAAICDLVARENTAVVFALSSIGGVFLTMVFVAFGAPGVGVVLHPAALFGIGAVAGIAGLYVCGALLRLAGSIVGGHATRRELQRVLAWTAIPNIFAISLIIVPWLIWVALGAAFQQSSEPQNDWPVLTLFMLLVSPLGFWGLFVTVRAISTVLKVGFVQAIFCLFLVGSVTGYAMVQLSALLDRRLPSFLVPNEAMLPTLRPAQRVLRATNETLQRGDIVRFARIRHHPHFGMVTTRYVKRVIGLPGDVIAMTGGTLSINGETVKRQRMVDFDVSDQTRSTRSTPHLQETLPNGVRYRVLDSDPTRTFGEVRVGADQVFLLGDNRDNSEDMEDTYQGRPKPAHQGLVWRDRVYAKAVSISER